MRDGGSFAGGDQTYLREVQHRDPATGTGRYGAVDGQVADAQDLPFADALAVDKEVGVLICRDPRP